MNVHEALQKLLDARISTCGNIDFLAPHIETALRAAYCAGLDNAQIPDYPDTEVGVSAGIAAMIEEL